MPTDNAVARYQKQFRRPSSSDPAWLNDLRQSAMARFQQTGFPTTHDEEWRFTSVQPIAETPFELAQPAGDGVSPDAVTRLLGNVPGPRMVLVDGRWSRSLSRLEEVPTGITVENLPRALVSNADLIRPHLARHARYEAGGFPALSAAFLEDGAVVQVGEGVESETPLHLVFLSTGHQNRVSHPRCLVNVARGGRAIIQESYFSLSDGHYFTNAVTELIIGEGGRLDHCRIQRESHSAYHIATTQSYQARDSVLESCSVAFGAALSRHNIGAVLDGSGAFLTLNGLSVLAGKQHVDCHTVIDHAQPHCESHELFNGVFAGSARGVFNGRIIVRPGAQRTDSKQTNNNLLLSTEARADSQPQLEIYADDVKCTHGATLGPLDDASMFYLQSRGIDVPAARRLLTYGFGADVLGRIRSAPIRAALDAVLLEQLASLPLSEG